MASDAKPDQKQSTAIMELDAALFSDPEFVAMMQKVPSFKTEEEFHALVAKQRAELELLDTSSGAPTPSTAEDRQRSCRERSSKFNMRATSNDPYVDNYDSIPQSDRDAARAYAASLVMDQSAGHDVKTDPSNAATTSTIDRSDAKSKMDVNQKDGQKDIDRTESLLDAARILSNGS